MKQVPVDPTIQIKEIFLIFFYNSGMYIIWIDLLNFYPNFYAEEYV